MVDLDYRITTVGIVKIGFVVVDRIVAVVTVVACIVEHPLVVVLNMVHLRKQLEPYLDLHRMLVHNLVSNIGYFHTEVFLDPIFVFCCCHLNILLSC
jgi:hypothetical protein